MTRSRGRRGPRIALVAPALELAQWWGPVLAALDARTGAARLFTGQPWVGLADDPAADLVEVVGTAARVGGRDEDGAYDGVMRLSPRILTALWRFRPDVVIVQGFSLWTMMVLAARPLARWRVVLLWEGSTPRVDRRGSALHTRLRRQLARRADWVMTSNSRSHAYLHDHLGVPARRILVHPYLVGSPAAMMARRSEADDLDGLARPVLVHVGRLEPRKGVAELLRALGALATGHAFTLVVVGKGFQEPELRALATAGGLDGHVRWLGWRDYGQVGGVIEAADLLVFPTLEDTWGMVAVEAMALGTAVACSTAAGASEVITDGVDGLLLDPRDQVALTAVLRRALVDVDLAAMGRRAQERARTLTPDAAAHALLTAATLADSRRRV